MLHIKIVNSRWKDITSNAKTEPKEVVELWRTFRCGLTVQKAKATKEIQHTGVTSHRVQIWQARRSNYRPVQTT